MNVTEIKDNLPSANEVVLPPTDENMQSEYSFLLADSIISKLLHEGLLNNEEADKVRQQCRKNLLPEIASLYD